MQRLFGRQKAKPIRYIKWKWIGTYMKPKQQHHKMLNRMRNGFSIRTNPKQIILRSVNCRQTKRQQHQHQPKFITIVSKRCWKRRRYTASSQLEIMNFLISTLLRCFSYFFFFINFAFVFRAPSLSFFALIFIDGIIRLCVLYSFHFILYFSSWCRFRFKL